MSSQPKIIAPLKLKNSTKQYFKKARLREAIIQEIQQLPDFNRDLKFDNEIIEAVLQIINEKFYKRTDEERKNIAVSILKDLFTLTPDEINIITKTIDYMYENKIIKKHSVIISIGSSILSYLFKKA
jgi:hypothetical protein